MAGHILFVAFQDQLHKCHLPTNTDRVITIGNSWSSQVTIPEMDEEITLEWDGKKLIYLDNEINEIKRVDLKDKTIHFYIQDEEQTIYYDIAGNNSITFGSQEYNDVTISGWDADIVLVRDENHTTFYLDIQDGDVFYNYGYIKEDRILHIGDQLFIDGVSITVHPEHIELRANKEIKSRLTELINLDNPYEGDYPDYHRSPRIIYREPEDKRTIAKPANKPAKPSEQLARTIVPPLVMIAALVIISLVQPRGIFIIAMLAVTVVTIIFSITSYVKSVKKYKADMKHREETYKKYLQRKTKELFEASEEQRHALHYHYPDVEIISEMVTNIEARIYEKTMYHHDFLNFRTGLGRVDSSFEIEFNEEEFTQEEDELVDAARDLLGQFNELRNVPVVTSLAKGPVGYIGQRKLVLEQLQLIVMQLSLFHSYHDLQFITIFPEEEKKEWDWMRWLPHASVRDINVRGFVYHERSRDQVLHSMYQVLKERKQLVEEKSNTNEKLYFSPHYVVLVTDEKLILDHTIMEFFNEDPSELGVSIVFVQDVMRALPEHVKTVIDIRDANEGKIILEETELVNKSFKPDHFPKNFNKEVVSRALAPINHLQNLKNSIPEQVTFLELYNVEKVEELNIQTRWSQNETYKSLAVPLGLRGKEDLVQLNLHEKAHGPHGLVAGTTGSGKSEIIQSYILSLAVNFHPYEVAFLLIDYKGGGMANLFAKLPHLMGTITNLDKAQSMRALASIKAELQKRQRLFGEHQVNHINQYQKLFKQGKVTEPMPHLFLISDEFAELKSEQPDFMKELVSTARIGRSLGIHLILATQKPSGVVDDQIWSNSKFKLALKVQNAGDSNEILKTPDAAEITLPGRAYLQVGNNEIYELFQSAWSGADYIPDKNEQDYVDMTIYAINELGQYDILTEDLSGLEHKEEVEKIPTELDAVIDHIADYTEKQEMEPLAKPWLPPLPEKIFGPELHPVAFEEAWKEPKKPLQPMIGLLDQPELQKQSPLTLNLSKDGHLAVFSSPGYGKSTFLQTVVMDLARQHNPEHFHVYLLDFGTNGLLPLKNLPHVADTFLIDEEEKIGKLVRMISTIVKQRKQQLSKYGVANIEMFEKASGETVPNISLVIDNYESVRDAEFVDEFEKTITQIAREGASIGIHLIISAGRQSAMRMPLLSNIKTQIALYLIETTEARSIVGRTDIELEEIAGRGLVKLEEPALFQTMLPENGAEALEIIDKLQATAKAMDEAWGGEYPEPIPMMPEGVVDFEQFKNQRRTKKLVEEQKVPLGLDFEEVMPVGFNPAQYENLTVMSDRKDGLDRMIQSVAKNVAMMDSSYQTMLIDTADQKFKEIGIKMSTYMSETEGLQTIKAELVNEIEKRSKDGVTSEQKWLVQIANLQDFVERTDLSIDDASTMVDKGSKVGIHFIICSEYSYLGMSYEQVPKYFRGQAMIGLLSMRLGDQDMFKQPFIRQEKYPNKYECYVALDHQHVKVKIPE
ncbi:MULTISPECIES: type VII secretion protein EssC [unclassified Oceanobacillus]|uniref:type VII secretion protein EssC n=1 Tax=unclassified Oceanobacillus TaxID=2630292 RepID=UPI001BEA5933|nr:MULTISPECIES: type VII secretion protein EssC [unclassified Oceanobacillus]MBT2598935.1 type VII secretion protein EssC [Oceanobacillus sp. ISL-74]MBT2651854.1 type VII secretion protein EssC [Oceanobacillus sp. ISL-73]